MDPRVQEIADRLEAAVTAGDPMSDFVLTFFRNMLDQWGDLSQTEVPAPFGETPLLQLVESMLPTVEAQDRSSSALIRLLLDKVKVTSNPQQKRELALALEWFYRYFNKQTDLEFEPWLELRQKGPAQVAETSRRKS
jgi:hypothetical protein